MLFSFDTALQKSGGTLIDANSKCSDWFSKCGWIFWSLGGRDAPPTPPAIYVPARHGKIILDDLKWTIIHLS